MTDSGDVASQTRSDRLVSDNNYPATDGEPFAAWTRLYRAVRRSASADSNTATTAAHGPSRTLSPGCTAILPSLLNADSAMRRAIDHYLLTLITPDTADDR
jgi:hypothetical protein